MSTLAWKAKNKEKMKKYRLAYYYKNRQSEIRRIRKRKESIQVWFQDYKKNLKCPCGESHPATLDFHHPGQDKKDGGVCKMVQNGSSIDSILKEISKCVVMCSNCHRKLHWDKSLPVA